MKLRQKLQLIGLLYTILFLGVMVTLTLSYVSQLEGLQASVETRYEWGE